jgi:hypothetical protein
MLRRTDIDHILHAAASLSGHARFVMIGTGAVIATARPIPITLILTEEIDIYVEDVEDPEWVSDLIDASIGRDSQFHRTFGYYADGVRRRPKSIESRGVMAPGFLMREIPARSRPS